MPPLVGVRATLLRTSALVAVAALAFTAAPTVAGTAQVGQTLTATSGTYTGTPTSSTFYWSIGGVVKLFATGSTYVPVPGDTGKVVAVMQSITDGTNTVTSTSAATTAVSDAATPAASPTIPYGAKLAMIGDSITQQNAQGTSVAGDTANGGAQGRATGELTQVLSLEARVNAVNWYDVSKTTAGTNRLTNGADQGINGQNSTTIAARMSDITALAPGVLVIAAGTNNTQQGATVLADIQSMVNMARGNGTACIVATIRPNTAANESTNRARADIRSINASIRSYVAGLTGAPAVVLWDAYAQYDQGDGYMNPLDTYDRLLHPCEAGAELGAWGNDPTNPSPYSLTAAIRKLVQPGDVYADTMAANANVLLNPTLTGSTGTLDTGFTGQAPANWRWEKQGTVNSSLAASVVANAVTGGQSAVAVITPAGAATYERINFRLSAYTQNISNLAGLWARFFVELETDGAAWMMAPSVILTELDAGTAKQSGIGFQPTLNPGTGNFLSPLRPNARRRRIMTEPLLLGPNVTGLQPYVQFNYMPNGAAGPSTVKVHRAWMATVPNPKTAWNAS